MGDFKKEGIKGILNKKRIGNRRNLSHTQEEELLLKYKEKAEKGQLVTIKEIEKGYRDLVDHEIGNSQIYRVLKRHEWRKEMPISKRIGNKNLKKN